MSDFIVPMRDKPKEFSGNTPWTRIEDIEGKYLNGSLSGQYVSNETIKKMNLKIIPEGSLIVSASATFGVVAIVTRDLITNQTFIGLVPKEGFDLDFLYVFFQSPTVQKKMKLESAGSTIFYISRQTFEDMKFSYPNYSEQKKIGTFFTNLDNLITLHQRMLFTLIMEGTMEIIRSSDLFFKYYEQWVKVYKEGAIREVTMAKYRMTLKWVKELVPTLKLYELNRTTYQQLLNEYALCHEKQTTMDFHHQLKGAILDAVDDGLIDIDPTRKAIIKGKPPRKKKPKFLNQFELNTLIKNLNLEDEINWDWLILLIAKTGMRFSEALGLTPNDFDFSYQTVSVNKTWDYKSNSGFQPTKNKSSIRKIQIDWQTASQFVRLIKNMRENDPIFVKGKVYNSTVNNILARHCKQLGIPIISIHGLRHTHASLLLFAGVSMASVARRLGHSSMTTTQKTYLHIIHELENQDTDLIIRSISQLV